jgi:carbon-monoxide dehydrogenase large subunit
LSELAIARGKYVGASVSRLEDPALLAGEARYVADMTLPRMLHAAFVRSPVPHAEIRSIDTSGAKALPGVEAVFTGEQIESHPMADPVMIETLTKTPQFVIARDRVRFVGEAVAVVVAVDAYVAEDAAALVEVDYADLGAVTTVEESRAEGAPQFFDDVEANTVFEETKTWGDPAKAFAEADRTYKHTLRANRFLAAPMETRGVLASYEPAEGNLTVWSSTQMPDVLSVTIAGLLAFPAQNVRVVAPHVGGGFGQKMASYPEEIVIPFLAIALGRPIKWIEDRRENLLAAMHSKEQVIEIEAAVDDDGTIRAFRSDCAGDAGGYSFNATSALIEPWYAATLMPGVYHVDDYETHISATLTNKTPVGPYRGVGWTPGHTARELILDSVARDLGLDPAELRKKNMIRSDEFPYAQCTGQVYDSGSFVESVDAALELVGYAELRQEQAAGREQGRYIGIGISPYVEPTGFGTEIASQQAGFPFPSHDNATVTMDPSGKVTCAVSVTTQGQGHKTTFAQITADALGIEVEDVAVVQGDTASAPFGMGTYASRAAVVAGGAVALAVGEVREKLLKASGLLLEAAPEDLTLEDSRVFVKGSPDRGMAVAEAAIAAYWAPNARTEGEDPYLSSTRFYDPKATYGNGCIISVAEVDVGTGRAQVTKVAAVEDCGTVLNPMIVDGQVRGAIAQGIGGAIYEDMVYDETAQPLSTTYLDYLLPTATEVPEILVGHLETPSPVTMGGIKGMGESGLIAAPGSVISAVLDAIAPFEPDLDTLELPLTPDRVLRLIGRVSA